MVCGSKNYTGNNYNGIGVISEKNPYMNKGTDYLSSSNDALHDLFFLY